MNLDSCKPVFVFIFITCAKGSSFSNIECCHVQKKKKISFAPSSVSGVQKNNMCTVEQVYPRALLQAE